MMGERHRAETNFRVTQEGKNAFLDGKPITANPYKKSPWGNGYAWEVGWMRAEQKKSERKEDGSDGDE